MKQGKPGMREGCQHLPTVAPVAARVDPAHPCPAGVGQQPELRRGGVQAIPGVAAQHRQPELAPRGDVGRTLSAVYLQQMGMHIEAPEHPFSQNLRFNKSELD